MATFSNEQFKDLLSAIMQPQTQQQLNTNPPKNDPAALGPIRPCNLGTNKMLKLTLFEEWLEEAENRMAYIGTDDDKSKIILLKSWGGAELIEFMKNTAKIETTDDYTTVIDKIKIEFTKLVNRTMAMHSLLTTKPGTRSWMPFIHNLEKKAKILDFERRPYQLQDAVKDAAIF